MLSTALYLPPPPPTLPQSAAGHHSDIIIGSIGVSFTITKAIQHLKQALRFVPSCNRCVNCQSKTAKLFSYLASITSSTARYDFPRKPPSKTAYNLQLSSIRANLQRLTFLKMEACMRSSSENVKTTAGGVMDEKYLMMMTSTEFATNEANHADCASSFRKEYKFETLQGRRSHCKLELVYR